MDELEFRRRLFADPNDKDVIAQADTDPAKQRLVKEMQDFDATLHSALDISVPDDLAQKILAKQQADTETSSKQSAEVKQLAWYRRFKAPLATLLQPYWLSPCTLQPQFRRHYMRANTR